MLKKTKERGITLISLVITIILLLILATVAISLAVDSDGLFRKAGDAANKWNSSVAQEDAALGNLMTMLDEMDKLTLGEVYNEDMIGQSVTYEANGQSEWIILGEDTEKAGNILITTKAPIEDKIEIYQCAEKWFDYIDDLHTVCSLYGGTIQNIEVEARSITMEDINNVTGFDEPEEETYIFGTTQKWNENKVGYVYPEANSTITDYNGEIIKGWKKPEIENEATFTSKAYCYNDIGYKYNHHMGEWQTEVETTEHIDVEKLKVILGENKDLFYFVASTSVAVDFYRIFLMTSWVYSGFVGPCYGYTSGSTGGAFDRFDDSQSGPIRPVVSLPPNLLVEEVNGCYDIVQ